MSARDSAGPAGPGNGAAGGLANGGVGGGFGGGSSGGRYGGNNGAGGGVNGGYGSRTGLETGTQWHGNTAFGTPGGMATGYATRDARSLGQAGMGPTRGEYGQFQTMQGHPMFGGSPVQGQSFYGMNAGQAFSQAQRAQAAWQASQAARPQVGGLLGVSAHPAADREMTLPTYDEPLPPYEEPLPPEVVPMPPSVPNPNPPPWNLRNATPPSPYTHGQMLGKLDAYKSTSGPELNATRGINGNAYMDKAISNLNARGGYGPQGGYGPR